MGIIFVSRAGVVVSIGVNHTFKVVFTPLEYIPTIPPLCSYIINICLYKLNYVLDKYPVMSYQSSLEYN